MTRPEWYACGCVHTPGCPSANHHAPVPVDAPARQRWTLRLPFTGPPLTANDARSTSKHWGSEASAKRAVGDAVAPIVRAAHVPAMERIAVDLVWYVRGWGVHDADGLFPMLKAAVDGLTPPRPAVPKGTPTAAGTPRKKTQRAKPGAAIIPDDSARFVGWARCSIVLGSADQYVALVIVELPPLSEAPPQRPRPPAPARKITTRTRRSTKPRTSAPPPVRGTSRGGVTRVADFEPLAQPVRPERKRLPRRGGGTA